MDFKTVILTREESVGMITLNRPEALNALNDELIDELHRAVDIVSADEQTRVLIITGNDKAFCAGGDIKTMINMDPLQVKKYITPIHAVFNKITELPKPTIAAISGFTFGGGVELALTCDFRLAADNAKFGFPEINLGIFPAAGGSQRLPRLVGATKAKELMFTGDTIDASTAFSIGLVNQVVSREELMDSAKRLAKKLSSKPPVAIKMLKQAIHAGLNTDINTGLTIEVEKFCNLFATEDQKEGMAAFIERRKPDFKGK
ncbi:MAG: enoyl-CoA hydratase/isomerase family protein, partial [Syntrophomonadaceae bacterium]|nr:enoyl-CoA hydratase/isomerase family protein [Syntrophomonadaceae bacterium]